MANISRQRLAKRLLHNWLKKNPVDSNSSGHCNIDEDLMSLGWLTNVQKTQEPDVMSDIKPASKAEGSNLGYQKSVVHPPVVSMDNIHPRKCINPYVKPPYSYATLITMAINSTTEKKINISSLYIWISENFPYYKMADNHWKNSIRHNLSLNKRFEKVPRRPNESGKGGFWRLRNGQSEVTIKCASIEDVYVPSAKRVKLDENNQVLTNITSGNDVNMYYALAEKYTEEISNKDFNWSTALQNDIYVDDVKIKTENILNDDEFTSGLSPPAIPSDDENTMSSFSSAPSSDVTSQDLSCFDDLLVFSCNNSGNKETEDGALDLSMPLDGNGDHDWWEKALNLSEECDIVSEKKTVIDEDCKDIYIPPLDNVFKDICDMFSLDSVL